MILFKKEKLVDYSVMNANELHVELLKFCKSRDFIKRGFADKKYLKWLHASERLSLKDNSKDNSKESQKASLVTQLGYSYASNRGVESIFVINIKSKIEELNGEKQTALL